MQIEAVNVGFSALSAVRVLHAQETRVRTGSVCLSGLFDRPEEELGKDSAGFGSNVAGKNADASQNVSTKRGRLKRFRKFSGRMDLRVDDGRC